ncbi:hypothetical protein [Lysinibacillus sp. ZYM-1]|uniref:hypothetical protein n=1 Tax=Lysinibacillus sp. ZYM-1 TaxID=1681184 RepID=UPI0006CE7F1E|nr:hypothetical protein [Lysinibacillus sp. ZYM-1]KPN96934.1 hypothetical protein AO843_01210 [Lysinibacillus sp. ZYM-1]
MYSTTDQGLKPFKNTLWDFDGNRNVFNAIVDDDVILENFDVVEEVRLQAIQQVMSLHSKNTNKKLKELALI